MNTNDALLGGEFEALVTEASHAPSVHNIQPALWTADPSGNVIHLTGHPARTLPVGDPGGRDVAVSLGAAAEGMTIALSRRGMTAEIVPENSEGLSAAYQIRIADSDRKDPLTEFTDTRMTWRGNFLRASHAQASALSPLNDAEDVILLTSTADLSEIARLNDTASMRFFRHTEYREELRSWMRFSEKHPDWLKDGLNADAMAMSGIEARLAGWLLSKGPFEIADRFGLMSLAMSEKSKVKSATAVLLYHHPRTETPFQSGRRFYRLWLEITAAGFDACPMAVLADDADVNQSLCRQFQIPENRRLINAFRIGLPPQNRPFRRIRRPAHESIRASK